MIQPEVLYFMVWMSLFIGFVPVHVQEKELSDAFTETFDATVLVRFSKEKVNQKNMKYKSATIEVVTMTRGLSHFIREIDEYGSNTFLADKNKYRVQASRERDVPVQVTHVKPYIM